MANMIFPKGTVTLPYDEALLKRVVEMSGGKMLPRNRFTCTMHSKEKPGTWTLPSLFRCRYAVDRDRVTIEYQVFPSWIVWLMLFTPVIALSVVLAFRLDDWLSSAAAFLTGMAVVCYGIQRKSAIQRFEKLFGS